MQAEQDAALIFAGFWFAMYREWNARCARKRKELLRKNETQTGRKGAFGNVSRETLLKQAVKS